MWSQPDRFALGNLFIKNLDKTIDNVEMYSTFSAFGSILSCKVATDESNRSKGYGFVHFETEEAANMAIEKVNGIELNGKKVYVGKFIAREEREKQLAERAKRFTSVYIKNFGDELDDDKLKDLFEKCGKISSHKVVTDENRKSKGFGFVSFEEHESAAKAVVEMNGKQLNTKILHVGRAKTKAECQAEFERTFERVKMERLNRYQGVNLYVKHLDDTIDDERLRIEFAPFGTITSAKVMVENGRSRGFGFVCFSSPEEATEAVTNMNGRILGSRTLYVALAQRNEDRKAHLASQHMQRMAAMRMQVGQMFQQSSAGYFVPTMAQTQRFYTPAQMAQVRASPRRPTQLQLRPGAQATSAFPRSSATAAAAANQQAAMRSSMTARPITGQQPGRVTGVAPSAMRVSRGAAICTAPVWHARPPNYKYTPNMRNPPQAVPAPRATVQQAVHLHGQEPLTSDMLATATPQEQKQMLGERLLPLIQRVCPDWAGKITGMLLEIDNSQLLHALEHHECLKAKIEEAVAVLQVHQAKQRQYLKPRSC